MPHEHGRRSASKESAGGKVIGAAPGVGFSAARRLSAEEKASGAGDYRQPTQGTAQRRSLDMPHDGAEKTERHRAAEGEPARRIELIAQEERGDGEQTQRGEILHAEKARRDNRSRQEQRAGDQTPR